MLTCPLFCRTVRSSQYRNLWRLHRSSSWPGCGRCACRCATTGVDVDSGDASTSSPEFVDIPLRNRDRYAQVQFLAVFRRDEETPVEIPQVVTAM